MKLPGVDALGSVGLVGERKAVALLCLGFYTTLFFMIGLQARTELPEWLPVFIGMLVVYVTAFMGVAAEWFWGRWFATGLGYWGCTMAIMAFVTTRSLPAPMIIFGVMHALIAVCLMGEKMAAAFDAKPEWRARWKLDEQGVVRVRRSVTRAASSLPALIMFALAPREQAGSFAAGWDFTAMLLGALAIAALIGLLTSLRTWTVLTLAAVGLAVLVHLGTSPTVISDAHPYFAAVDEVPAAEFPFAGMFGGVLLLIAAVPFLGPIASYVLRRR